jgi:hypothetical protein
MSHVRRREFITLLGCALAAWPLAARVQQATMPVVGLLGATWAGGFAVELAAFRAAQCIHLRLLNEGMHVYRVPKLPSYDDRHEDGEIVFRHACKLGLEGIVSKRKDSTYRSGRSPDLAQDEEPGLLRCPQSWPE